MVDATSSGCINHPGVEASARCKQCGKPVCSTCQVTGTTGIFCSEVCRDKHHEFLNRAHQLEQMRKPGRDLVGSAKRFIGKLLVWLLVLVAAAFVAAYFGMNIPVVSDIVRQLQG